MFFAKRSTIVCSLIFQEYEELLEQQKILYDSKLEQLDQLHQQKQVSLVSELVKLMSNGSDLWVRSVRTCVYII